MLLSLQAIWLPGSQTDLAIITADLTTRLRPSVIDETNMYVALSLGDLAARLPDDLAIITADLTTRLRPSVIDETNMNVALSLGDLAARLPDRPRHHHRRLNH